MYVLQHLTGNSQITYRLTILSFRMISCWLSTNLGVTKTLGVMVEGDDDILAQRVNLVVKMLVIIMPQEVVRRAADL